MIPHCCEKMWLEFHNGITSIFTDWIFDSWLNVLLLFVFSIFSYMICIECICSCVMEQPIWSEFIEPQIQNFAYLEIFHPQINWYIHNMLSKSLMTLTASTVMTVRVISYSFRDVSLLDLAYIYISCDIKEWQHSVSTSLRYIHLVQRGRKTIKISWHSYIYSHFVPTCT